MKTTFPLQELYDCIIREMALRQKRYGKSVAKGEMDYHQSIKEMLMMREIADILMTIKEAPVQEAGLTSQLDKLPY